jgi:D-glycero-D-manno-heptose 1,7-bisphosphate phosphatase
VAAQGPESASRYILSAIMLRAAVFLDRDNTLIANDSTGAGHGDLGDPELVRLQPGVAEGLKTLREAGFALVVVTNQGGVARGRYTESDVDAVHQRIAQLVDAAANRRGVIDRFYYCPYHPEGTVEEYRREHPWRKPAPGMILQAAHDMNLDLQRSWLVGDQDRDIAAGRAAGVRTLILASDADAAAPSQATAAASSFADAVKIILREPPAVRGSRPDLGAGPAVPAEMDPLQDPVDGATLRGLRRAISELTEEIRSERLRRIEFTPLKLVAGAFQLLTLLLALLGLLQLADADLFLKWMIGAALMQLLTIAVLLADSR